MSGRLVIVIGLLAFVAAQDDLLEQHAEYPTGIKGPFRPKSYRWATLQNVGTRFPHSVIITEKKTSNYHGCVGVPISKQHVLISRSCNIDLTKKLLAVVAETVNWDLENSFSDVSRVDNVGANLAVVTLQEEIRENIVTFNLPSEDLRQGGVYLSFGWGPICRPVKSFRPVFSKEISISNNEDCGITDSNLACGRDFSKRVGTASPIVNELVIHGFTDFECSKKGAVVKVFPFINSIRTIMQEN